MSDPRVLFVVDNHFAQHLRFAIASVRVSNPELEILVHLINWTEEEQDRLTYAYECTISGTEEHSYSDDRKRKAYAANRRARVIADLLQASEGPLIYLDADSCVRKPVTGMLELLEKNDLVVHHRAGRKAHTRLAVGVLGWSQTDAAAKAAEDWAQRVEPQQLEWFTEQRTLWETIRAQPELRVGKLPLPFIDWTFQDGSPIWAAKGPRKGLDTYKAECFYSMQAYLKGKPWADPSSS